MGSLGASSSGEAARMFKTKLRSAQAFAASAEDDFREVEERGRLLNDNANGYNVRRLRRAELSDDELDGPRETRGNWQPRRLN